MTNIQFIERDGQLEYAVIPIAVWERVKNLLEDIEDATLIDAIKSKDDGLRIPAAVVDAELAGDTPIKAWREYRRISQDGLAKAAGISKPYLSQIENRRRRASSDVLLRLAAALEVSINILEEDENE